MSVRHFVCICLYRDHNGNKCTFFCHPYIFNVLCIYVLCISVQCLTFYIKATWSVRGCLFLLQNHVIRFCNKNKKPLTDHVALNKSIKQCNTIFKHFSVVDCIFLQASLYSGSYNVRNTESCSLQLS